MGGIIFVGVRTQSGAEHIGTTWTNWLPYAFAQKSTHRDEAKLLVDGLRASWADEDPRCAPARQIHNAEYGVVLIDIPHREIWDHNAYFTPLRWYANGGSREGAAYLVEALEGTLYATCSLSALGHEPFEWTPSESELNAILRAERRYAQGGDRPTGPREVPGVLQLRFDWSRLVHTSNQFLRGKEDWEALRMQVERWGWTSSVGATPAIPRRAT